MAKPKATRGKRSPRTHQKSKEALHVRVIIALTTAFSKAVDRFGTAAVVLVLMLYAVSFLGDAKTKNDFLREMLFGELNKYPFLSGFFGVLVILALLGGKLRLREKKMESAEIKRLREENARLQARLLGSPYPQLAQISHIEPPQRQLQGLGAGSNLPAPGVEADSSVPKVSNGRVGGAK